MSREIKFRAWDKKRKCYAKAIQTTNQGWKGYRDKTYITNGIMCFSKWVLSRFIIEQYTGAEDKNGKEIYEGDIVSVHNKNHKNEYDIGVVEFGKAAFRCPFLLGKYQSGQVEVIGNIHENPELLGGKG